MGLSPLPEHCPEAASPLITAPHGGAHSEPALYASKIGLEGWSDSPQRRLKSPDLIFSIEDNISNVIHGLPIF